MLIFLLSFLQKSLFAAFHGPYVGGNVGGSYLRGEYKLNNTDNKAQINNLSYTFGFMGGYLYNVDNSKMLFGGEFGTSYPGNNPSKSALSLSINERYIMNASLIGGLIMNPRTALGIRFGIDWNSISLKVNNKPQCKTTQSVAPGAVLFYKFSEHVLGNISYVFSIGRKISSKDGSGTYQPRQHRLVVGVSYLF